MQVEFEPVPAQGRCRIRNRALLEKPLASHEGPIPRNGASMLSAHGKLWVFGGLCEVEGSDDYGNTVTNKVPTNEMWGFDVEKGLWSWYGCIGVGPLPSPRWKHSAFVVDNGSRILVLGGALDPLETAWATTEPYLFDLESETWSKPLVHGDPPHKGPFSVTPFAAFDDTRFLLVGVGTVREGSWDGISLFWAATRSVPQQRAQHEAGQAASVADLVVCFGGGNGVEAFGATAKVSGAEIGGAETKVSHMAGRHGAHYRECSLPPLPVPGSSSSSSSSGLGLSAGAPAEGPLLLLASLASSPPPLSLTDGHSTASRHENRLTNSSATRGGAGLSSALPAVEIRRMTTAAKTGEAVTEKQATTGKLREKGKHKKSRGAPSTSSQDDKVIGDMLSSFQAKCGIATLSTTKKWQRKPTRRQPPSGGHGDNGGADCGLLFGSVGRENGPDGTTAMGAKSSGGKVAAPSFLRSLSAHAKQCSLTPAMDPARLLAALKELLGGGGGERGNGAGSQTGRADTSPRVQGGEAAAPFSRGVGESPKHPEQPPALTLEGAAAVGCGACLVLLGGVVPSVAQQLGDWPGRTDVLSIPWNRRHQTDTAAAGHETRQSKQDNAGGHHSELPEKAVSSSSSLEALFVLDCLRNEWVQFQCRVGASARLEDFVGSGGGAGFEGVEESWFQSTPLRRSGHCICFLDDGRLFVFGGTEGDSGAQAASASVLRPEGEEEALGAGADLLLCLNPLARLAAAHEAAASRANLGLGDFGSDARSLAEAMAQQSGEAWKAVLLGPNGATEDDVKQQQQHQGSGGGGVKPDDDLHVLWDARELKPWEEKGDVRMKLPGGEVISIVVDNLSKLVETVGSENCFE